MADDIRRWLEELGLGEYATAFEENRLELSHLPDLSEDDLRELGVTAMGDRKTLLRALEGLEARPEAVVDEGPQRPPSSVAERRQLTVLFCDLVGSTALSDRLDPEDMREVMRAYQDAVAAAVGDHDGHVANYLGDGIVTYFGWPHAFEDQAERAVRAGLAAVAAVGSLETTAGGPLAARVGIATGQVVVGDLSGDVSHQSDAISGRTPNLAARIQELAEPGEVVIEAATRQLVGANFDLADGGRHELKGLPDPVAVWRVTGRSAVESRFEAYHQSGMTPFVGRETEIGLLLDRWGQARGGEGQVLLLSGEAGIGKSRIVDVLRERIGGEATVVHFQCSPYHQNSPFYPYTTQFEHAAGFAAGDDNDEKLGKLESLLLDCERPKAQTTALIGAMLGLATEDRYPPLEMSPERQLEETHVAMLQQLGALSGKGPVVVIAEDLHWSDPSSLEQISRTIDFIDKLPVLLLLTCRPEFTPSWPSHQHSTMLTLNRLSREQREAMIARVTGGRDLPAEVLAQIVERTDGVPLFVEELTKTVLESGLVAERDGAFELTGALPGLGIPASLQDSLVARLDRLSPVKEVAQVAAAIGREFSRPLLEAVAPMGGNELSEALQQLVNSELVFRRGAPPNESYQFKHALVRDAAYEGMLISQRQQLHQKIADRLEQLWPELADEQPELLALHLSEAGNADRAVDFWLKAGEASFNRSANAEAKAHLEKGIEQIEQLPDTEARRSRELTLRAYHVNAIMRWHGYTAPELADRVEDVLRLCEQSPEHPYFFGAVRNVAAYHAVSGRIEAAWQVMALLSREADRQDDILGKLVDQHMQGYLFQVQGDFLKSREHFERAIAYFNPDDRARMTAQFGDDFQTNNKCLLALTEQSLGHLDRALELVTDGRREARIAPAPQWLCYAEFFTCYLLCLRGEAEGVLERTTRLNEMGENAMAGMWQLGAMTASGWAKILLNRRDEGKTELRVSMDMAREGHLMANTGIYAAVLGETELADGNFDAARREIESGLAYCEASTERWHEAELLHQLGRLELAEHPDRQVDATHPLSKSLDLSRRQDARFFELRTAMTIARHWHAGGRTPEARELLAPIHGWFTEGLDTPDLLAAKALLDELN